MSSQEFMPLDFFKVLIQYAKVFTFDWRVTILMQLVICIGIVLFSLGFLVFFQVNPEAKIATNFQTQLEGLNFTSQSSDLIIMVLSQLALNPSLQKNIARFSFEYMTLNLNNSVPVSPGVCPVGCLCENSTQSTLYYMDGFFDKSIPESEDVYHSLRKVTLDLSKLTPTTGQELRTSGWLPSTLSSGDFILEILYFASLDDNTSFLYRGYNFQSGRLGEIVNKHRVGFSISLSATQQSLDICSAVFLGFYVITFLFRYLFTVNIMYTFMYMLLGCFKLVVITFCFVVSLLKYTYWKQGYKADSVVPNPLLLHQLIYCYHLFRCCFLLVCILTAFEITSMFIHAKSLKELRKNTVAMLRTGPGVFKLFTFTAIMIVLSSVVIACNDSILGVGTITDLIFSYTAFPLNTSNSTSQAMNALRRIFLHVVDYLLLSLVFAGLYTGLNIE